jgi:WD40 repeat protein
VAFSCDGQTVASGSDDETVWLWDVATGAHRQTLEGFTQNLTFDQDEGYVFCDLQHDSDFVSIE